MCRKAFSVSLWSVLAVAIAVSSAARTGWRASADELAAEPKFIELFDGETLAGWEGDTDLWKVDQGCIVGDSPGIQHNQFLATRREFGDFELELEFRLRDGKGNSGIQFRSKRVAGSTEVSGYQADIGENYWGCLYDESRRNRVLVQAAKDLEPALKKDEWNSYTIRVVDDRITLAINGVKTVEYVERDNEIARSGIIALQVHSGPPLRVEFRKIRIRELKPGCVGEVWR